MAGNKQRSKECSGPSKVEEESLMDFSDSDTSTNTPGITFDSHNKVTFYKNIQRQTDTTVNTLGMDTNPTKEPNQFDRFELNTQTNSTATPSGITLTRPDSIAVYGNFQNSGATGVYRNIVPQNQIGVHYPNVYTRASYYYWVPSPPYMYSYNVNYGDPAVIFEQLSLKVKNANLDINTLLDLHIEYIELTTKYPYYVAQFIKCSEPLRQKSVMVEQQYKFLLNNISKAWNELKHGPDYELKTPQENINYKLLLNAKFQLYGQYLHNHVNLSQIAAKLKEYDECIIQYNDVCKPYVDKVHVLETNTQTKNDDFDKLFTELTLLEESFNKFEETANHYLATFKVKNILTTLENIKRSLIIEKVNKECDECQLLTKDVELKADVQSNNIDLNVLKNAVDEKLNIIDYYLPNLMSKMIKSKRDEFHWDDILGTRIKNAKETLNACQQKLTTVINKDNLMQEVEEFCFEVDSVSTIFDTFEGNLVDLRKLKEKIKNLRFDKRISNKELNSNLTQKKQKLKTLLEDLGKKETKLEQTEEIDNLKKVVNEIHYKVLKIETYEQVNELSNRNTAALSKFKKYSFTWVQSWYSTSAQEIYREIQSCKTIAQQSQELITKKRKLFKMQQEFRNELNSDINLITSCKDTLKTKTNASILRTLKDKIDNRIHFYQTYDFKEFSSDYSSKQMKSDQIMKLEDISTELYNEINFCQKKQLLGIERKNQEKLCTKAVDFWGNLSELKHLVNDIQNLHGEIDVMKFSDDALNLEKATILSLLEKALQCLENNKPVFQAKESLDDINVNTKNLQEAVNRINEEPSNDINSMLEKIKQYKSNVNINLTSVGNIMHSHNNKHLKDAAVGLRETLRSIRVKLDTIEFEWENMIQEDEDEDNYLENADKQKLSVNLKFLLDIGLSLMKILLQLNETSRNSNMTNLKAEFNDKYNIISNFKCNKTIEEEYIKNVFELCKKIKEKIPADTIKSDIVEEIKLESIKAIYFYTEIFDAKNIESSKACVIESKILTTMSKLDKLEVGQENDTLRETRKDILYICNQTLANL